MTGIPELAAAINLAFGVTLTCPPTVGPPDNPVYEGYANPQTRQVYLIEAHCRRLVFLREDRRFPRVFARQVELTQALFILAHELAHIGGYRSERAANCRAARTFARVGGRLKIAAWKVLAMRRFIGDDGLPCVGAA